MGWDAVKSGNLIQLELPSFEELTILWRETHLLILHALFKHDHLMGILTSLIDRIPRVPHLAGVFENTGMLQNAARSGSVGEEAGSVLLTGDSDAYCVFHHGNGAVSNQAIKAKSRDVKHILWCKSNLPVLLHVGIEVAVPCVEIDQLTIAHPLHTHFIWEQRVKGSNTPSTITYDLCIGIAPEQQVGHQCLTEDERGHFGIRLIVEQVEQRVVVDPRFVPTLIAIDVQREGSNRLCQHTHTGINRSGLHSCDLIDRLAAGRGTEQEGILRPEVVVFGLIPRPSESEQFTNTHRAPPKKRKRKAPAVSGRCSIEIMFDFML